MSDSLQVPDPAFPVSTSMSSSRSSNSSTLLPPGHPPVPVHEHLDGKCPITGQSHHYCPPQKDDVRSVCPALNTMANHGYIPRDGKNLTFSVLFHGLKNCYGLSSTLATVLVTGGFLGIGRSPIRIPFLSSLFKVKNPNGTISPSGVIDLHLIGLHNHVEHDASLVHLNTPQGDHYGPVKIQEDWVPMLVGDIVPPVPGYSPVEVCSECSECEAESSRSASSSSSNSGGSSYYASSYTQPTLQKFISDPIYQTVLVDEADVGRMRARRQREIHPKKLDAVHAEIARGEMAIILGVWKQTHGEKTGIPLPWLLRWLSEERLPEVPASDSESKSTSPSPSVNNSSTDLSAESLSKSSSTTLWRPSHKQTLGNVHNRSVAIKKVSDAIESDKTKRSGLWAGMLERFRF